jgi:hypothetical protein
MAKKAAKKSRRSTGKKKSAPRSVRLRPRSRKAPPGLVEKLREIDAQGEAYQTALPKISAEDRAEFDRVLAIRDGLIPPPRPPRKEGRQVSFAKELIAAVYPGDEWRAKPIRVVRHACASEAEMRGRQLPSPDSFARAMGRQHR